MMIGVNVGCGDDSGERMLGFGPLDAEFTLRPLNFYDNFETFTSDLAP